MKPFNYTTSECSKLVQNEYKTRHDIVGKEIHWEMCKKLKFDHTNKWYMQNPPPILENDTHKLLWDFDVHMDWPNLGQKTWPYNNQQKKRICKIVDFAVSANHRIKLNECEKDTFLDSVRGLKKLLNMK